MHENLYFSVDVPLKKHSIIHIKDSAKKEESDNEDNLKTIIEFLDPENEMVDFVSDGEDTYEQDPEFHRFFAWQGSAPIKSSKSVRGKSIQDIPPLQQVTVEVDMMKPKKRVITPIDTAINEESQLKTNKRKKLENEVQKVQTPSITSGHKPVHSIASKPIKTKLTASTKKSKFLSKLKSHSEAAPPADHKNAQLALKPHLPLISNGKTKMDIPSLKISKSIGNITSDAHSDHSTMPVTSSKSHLEDARPKSRFDDLTTAALLLSDFDLRFKYADKVTPEMDNSIDAILLQLLNTVYEIPNCIYDRLVENCQVPMHLMKYHLVLVAIPRLLEKVETQLKDAQNQFKVLTSATNWNKKVILTGPLKELAIFVASAFLSHEYVYSHMQSYKDGKYTALHDKKIRQLAYEKTTSLFKNNVERKRFQKLINDEKRKQKQRTAVVPENAPSQSIPNSNDSSLLKSSAIEEDVQEILASTANKPQGLTLPSMDVVKSKLGTKSLPKHTQYAIEEEKIGATAKKLME
eukprot:NODE_478_length_7890_cov_0.158388.p2 type:complete len:520 gc:universal NODE_478_length_7890_cov_0.158388:7630-6071(-)